MEKGSLVKRYVNGGHFQMGRALISIYQSVMHFIYCFFFDRVST